MAVLDKIARGEVTLAFRRWNRPSVKPGGRLRTAIGELAIDEVNEIALESISDGDACAAGFEDANALRAELTGRTDGAFYRVAFHLKGPDARLALREQDAGDDGDLASRLARLPWAVPALRLIAEREGRPAGELAEALGFEKPAFKQRIRKLKDLGLTESLQTGYRLSKRGRSVLEGL